MKSRFPILAGTVGAAALLTLMPQATMGQTRPAQWVASQSQVQCLLTQITRLEQRGRDGTTMELRACEGVYSGQPLDEPREPGCPDKIGGFVPKTCPDGSEPAPPLRANQRLGTVRISADLACVRARLTAAQNRRSNYVIINLDGCVR